MRYTHHGINAKPIPSTLRYVAGGRCIDILIDDPRSTLDLATVNADDVVDEAGEPFKPTPEPARKVLARYCPVHGSCRQLSACTAAESRCVLISQLTEEE